MAIFTNSLDPEQARQAWSGSKLLDILIMILKDFFWKFNFEETADIKKSRKISQHT